VLVAHRRVAHERGKLGLGHADRLEQERVRDDVHAASDQKEPYHGAGSRIIDHLVHTDLVRSRPALEEEVVQ